MKKSLFITAALAAILSTQAAEARRGGGGGYAEGLLFVAEVDTVGPSGNKMSLCILERTEKVMFIPLWRSAQAYALAENRCDAEQYYELSANEFARGKSLGAYAADLPEEPKLNVAQMLGGAWGLCLLVPLILFGIASKFGGSRRRKEPQNFVSRAVQVMCMVAKSDGHVSERELLIMQNVISQLTQKNIALDVVAEIVANTPGTMTDSDLRKLGKGLSEDERETLVQAAAMVAGGDGEIATGESHMIYRLSKAMKVASAKTDEMVERSMPSNAVPAE